MGRLRESRRLTRIRRRQLLEDLRSGDFNREWDAWKVIDSGVVGNWWVFLLYRFWKLDDYDIVLEPFWKRVLRNYSGLLWEWRLLLVGGEGVMILGLIISQI